MSILYLALLAAAVEEKNRRTKAYQASTQRNKTQKNDYEEELNDYYDNSMDLQNFLEAVLSKNAEATNIFLLMKKCHKEIDQEDINNSLQEFQNICQRHEPQFQLLQSAIANLKSNGIELDSTKESPLVYYPVKDKEGNGCRRYDSYTYKITRYNMGFNGMPLTKNMLEQSTNQFQIDLEKLTSTYPNLDEQLAEITAKIAKQKKKLKYNPFNKVKNQELLQSMQSLEKEIIEKIAHRTTLETQSKSFGALTETQKQAIIAYLEQIENCIVAGKEILAATNTHSKLEYEIEKGKPQHNYYRRLDLNEQRDIVNRIIKKAASQSDFSQEDIERIIEEIKIIMDANKFGYDHYKKISNRPYHYPTTQESMYAATFYELFYREKQKSKK